MKILFLDDDKTRHQVFLTHYGQFENTRCFGAEEAIDKMANNSYDLIFLDHDLSENYANSRPSQLDGTYVAGMMIFNDHIFRHNREATVILHSLNPKGAKEMYDTLKMGRYSNVIIAPLGFSESIGLE